MRRDIVIQRMVSNYFEISINSLVSARRNHRVSYPRKLAIYLCSKHTLFSKSQIARYFGKDHTTIGHAVADVERMLGERNSEVMEHIRDIELMMPWLKEDYVNKLKETFQLYDKENLE